MAYHQIKKSNYTFRERLQIFLFSLYFISQPFYIFSSGLPQISDYIMVLLICVIFSMAKFKIKVKWKNFLFLNLVFVIYIFIVNSIWSMTPNGDFSMLKNSLFYTYNFMAMLTVFFIYSRFKGKLYKILYYSTGISVGIQLMLYFLGLGRQYSSYRQIIFFNNPNQLGYFGLLAVTLIMVSYKKATNRAIATIVFLLSAFFLIAISHSKAAIVAGIFIIASMVLPLKMTNNMQKKIKTYLILLVVALIIINFIKPELLNQNRLFDSVKKRILSIGADADDSLAERGYDRIIRYPQYLIFGAGEGALERFNTHIEIHSTIGTVLFSYGIIGFTIFAFIIILVMWKQTFANNSLIISVLAYGLTHQGLRQTLFWILLSMLFLDKEERFYGNLKS